MTPATPPAKTPRTYSKSGLSVLKRAAKALGNRGLLDQRTRIGKALAAWRSDLVNDLGGADALSVQQHAIVDLCIREKLMLDSVDAWLLQQPGGLIDKRRRALLPVLKERQGLADALARHLGMLGLERRARKALTLPEYVAQRYGANGAEGVASQSDDARERVS